MADPLALPELAGGSVATVGTFDGVHRGHREILTALARCARAASLPSVVVTFRPHPVAVLRPGTAPPLLTPGDEQLDALADTGVDYIAVVPFTPSLSGYRARQFVRLLVDKYCMRELVVGYDHRLGHGREGTADALRDIGIELNIPVTVVGPKIGDDGVPVSSSVVRRAIESGDLDVARAGLGRRYSFQGHVVPGSQRGREIGFPTVNIAVDAREKLLPPLGVYAVRVSSSRGVFDGMLNLGGRPTFGDEALSPEVHLFDAEGDWYGMALRVEFVKWLRPTQRFDGLDALKAQLGQDANNARLALTQA